MSRKEMLDEFKANEGDPHLKSARRQRAQEVATNRMLTDVAKADVVVVNPTHYAVALRWDRTKRGAPICVAKGVDEIARRIRERAAEHGIPIHRDPPTARAMHASVEIGQEIRPEHYRAVAAAIRFADSMRKRARRT
jgi:flagellar biosynthetic protein FlhB